MENKHNIDKKLIFYFNFFGGRINLLLWVYKKKAIQTIKMDTKQRC